ncbi:MAG: hypothetical protein JSS49_09410 [Planctomycetes bacterium]|nr:hypothetical protein [Planctomycetota bacterium]
MPRKGSAPFFHGMLVITCCLVMIAAHSVSAQGTRGRDLLSRLREKHLQRYREFATQIDKLALACDTKTLEEGARIVRSKNIDPDSLSHNLRGLPREFVSDIPPNLPEGERFWKTQLRSLEKDYAQDLYLMSRRALNDGFPSYAYSLVREAAVHDPDHKPARKILGFVPHGNRWVTPFAAAQIKSGMVWNDKFGWLPKDDLTRYENGERKFKNRWVSVEKEMEARRDFANAWVIHTDHYEISTNVSLERGVEIGRSLEDFHEFFHEIFAGFFNTPEQMKRLFEGNSVGNSTSRRYQVHFYRTREEYIDRLKKDFPNIGITNGMYMTTGRTAHFYDDHENDVEATLFHEETHQLFYESHDNRAIGELAHFWIIEGIACYMESFKQQDGEFSLGDPRYIRFVGARNNLLQKMYYVPLAEFSNIGSHEFQHSAEVAKNYTQASGLARFFMEYDNGRYREALVRHLADLYHPSLKVRNHAQPLSKLTGVSFEELDRQYAEDAREIEKALETP